MIFGMVLLILTGLSWVVIGVVASHSARKHLNYAMIQFLSGCIGLCISGALLIFHFWPEADARIIAMTFGALFMNGLISYFGTITMGNAMKIGPHGLVWATAQSAFIFPFIFGIVVFGEQLTVFRLTGIILILLSVACYGIEKKKRGHDCDPGKKKNWYIPTLVALCLFGTNQCFANLPSYWPEAESVNSVFRAFATQVGTVAGWCVLTNKNLFKQKFDNFRKTLIYALVLVAVSLISSYLLLFRGLNILAEHNVGSISYPLIICSCIGGFFLYSTFVLREKTSLQQKIGFVLGTAGIIVISLNF